MLLDWNESILQMVSNDLLVCVLSFERFPVFVSQVPALRILLVFGLHILPRMVSDFHFAWSAGYIASFAAFDYLHFVRCPRVMRSFCHVNANTRITYLCILDRLCIRLGATYCMCLC